MAMSSFTAGWSGYIRGLFSFCLSGKTAGQKRIRAEEDIDLPGSHTAAMDSDMTTLQKSSECSSEATSYPKKRRRTFLTMFAVDALGPNTVLENLGFGPRRSPNFKGPPSSKIEADVIEMIDSAEQEMTDQSCLQKHSESSPSQEKLGGCITTDKKSGSTSAYRSHEIICAPAYAQGLSRQKVSPSDDAMTGESPREEEETQCPKSQIDQTTEPSTASSSSSRKDHKSPGCLGQGEAATALHIKHDRDDGEAVFNAGLERSPALQVVITSDRQRGERSPASVEPEHKVHCAHAKTLLSSSSEENDDFSNREEKSSPYGNSDCDPNSKRSRPQSGTWEKSLSPISADLGGSMSGSDSTVDSEVAAGDGGDAEEDFEARDIKGQGESGGNDGDKVFLEKNQPEMGTIDGSNEEPRSEVADGRQVQSSKVIEKDRSEHSNPPKTAQKERTDTRPRLLPPERKAHSLDDGVIVENCFKSSARQGIAYSPEVSPRKNHLAIRENHIRSPRNLGAEFRGKSLKAQDSWKAFTRATTYAFAKGSHRNSIAKHGRVSPQKKPTSRSRSSTGGLLHLMRLIEDMVDGTGLDFVDEELLVRATDNQRSIVLNELTNRCISEESQRRVILGGFYETLWYWLDNSTRRRDWSCVQEILIFLEKMPMTKESVGQPSVLMLAERLKAIAAMEVNPSDHDVVHPFSGSQIKVAERASYLYKSWLEIAEQAQMLRKLSSCLKRSFSLKRKSGGIEDTPRSPVDTVARRGISQRGNIEDSPGASSFLDLPQFQNELKDPTEYSKLISDAYLFGDVLPGSLSSKDGKKRVAWAESPVSRIEYDSTEAHTDSFRTPERSVHEHVESDDETKRHVTNSDSLINTTKRRRISREKSVPILAKPNRCSEKQGDLLLGSFNDRKDPVTVLNSRREEEVLSPSNSFNARPKPNLEKLSRSAQSSRIVSAMKEMQASSDEDPSKVLPFSHASLTRNGSVARPPLSHVPIQLGYHRVSTTCSRS
uniref:Uncharacterized protein n=1 Tax=Rhodosorus marinus TaxID=101924 RepID=A0A7S2ZAT5_9RHOD|mmetsp:Transcript_12654/g.51152  ORF Transcript_12654/g.51152 Transcript_12654/m.51152 type:complete len:998 (+) Transcript_12654:59-3052(+)